MNKLKFRNYVETEKDKFHIDDLVVSVLKTPNIHTHDFYEVFVVLDGEFIECINGEERKIKKNEIHFIHKDFHHGYKTELNNEKSVLRNIAIKESVFEEILQSYPENIFCDDVSHYSELSEEEYKEFIRKTSNVKTLEGTQFEYYMYSIITDLLSTRFIKKKSSGAPKWLINACKKMQEKDNFVVGQDRMFELCEKDKAHVARSLKKYYNMTVSEFINNLRLDYSTDLIDSSDKKIIDIIYECGFENISYFNRQFKSKFNMTPKEYRQRKKYF